MAEYALELSLPCLANFHVLSVDDAILERVWWIMDSRRPPLTYQTYSPASSAPLTEMSAKCGFGQHKWSQIVLFNAKLYK